MKLYAQHGYGPGDKIVRGLADRVIDGAIIGPKEVSPDSLASMLNAMEAAQVGADLLFDPQYYALQLPTNAANRLGYLEDYDFWPKMARNEVFWRNQDNIAADIRAVLTHQQGIPVSRIIAPNIIVRRSLDSREGANAESFIGLSKRVAAEIGETRPVLATLALSREALLNTNEVRRLANTLTSLEVPPDGFYLIVATSGDATDLCHAALLSNILFLTYSLKLNGYEVVWGYSDVVGAIAGAVGLDASASGWFGTLRNFTLNRFGPPSGGGQRARTKYFSVRLLNRILLGELLTSLRFDRTVRNQLPTDAPYFRGADVIEPASETEKCLQSWGSLKALQELLSSDEDIQSNLALLLAHVGEANLAYETLQRQGISFETATSGGHLAPIIEAIGQFSDQL